MPLERKLQKSAPSPSARTGVRHFAADKPTLLVLPLANIGEGTGQDYFADGITDSLIAELSRFSGMIVISRQTAFAYRNSPKRGDEIAEELGVEHLLGDERVHLGAAGELAAGRAAYRHVVRLDHDAAVAARFASTFTNKVNLFTIDEVFGGWTKAQQKHFADGGVFDRIYLKK